MRNKAKQKYVELAGQNGWTFAYADGYLDGKTYRRRRMTPSHYLLMGIDDYAQGFRAGYIAGQSTKDAA